MTTPLSPNPNQFSSNLSVPTNLKSLYTKRSSIKGQLTKFKNYFDKIKDSKEVRTDLEFAELNLKLNKIEGLSARFDDLQTEIEVLNAENLQAEVDERELIEDSIIQCIDILKVIVEWVHAASVTKGTILCYMIMMLLLAVPHLKYLKKILRIIH
ncbi:hypothetical protein ACJJTC_016992 [Scirpophaga incertulas]